MPLSGAGRGGRITRQPSNTSRPLVPVNERKSHEENGYTWRIKRDGEAEKTDIAPDGGSAGREGRQFAVANVGNNGRIYLRWVYHDRLLLVFATSATSLSLDHMGFL